MAQKYETAKIISTGSKGRAQVTVQFQGRTVTRHIVNGVGRHPDDSLPAHHRKLEERLSEAKCNISHKEEAIVKFTKEKPTDWEKFVVILQADILRLKNDLPTLENALEIVRKEDPLMVNFS